MRNDAEQAIYLEYEGDQDGNSVGWTFSIGDGVLDGELLVGRDFDPAPFNGLGRALLAGALGLPPPEQGKKAKAGAKSATMETVP